MKTFPLATTRMSEGGVGCLGVVLGLLLGFAGLAGVSLALAASFALWFDGRFLAASVCSGCLVLAIAGMTRLLTRSGARPAKRRHPAGPHVAVGADGVAIRAASTRYHAWDRVRGVLRDPEGGHVALSLDDGTLEELRVSDPVGLEHALRAARQRHREREPSPRLRVLELDGEMDIAWCERVRNAASDPSYRVEAVTEEALLEVLEDPTQAAPQRIGAALALARAPEAIKKRVHVAIEETAEPELSRDLERAASGELPAPRRASATARR